MNEWLINWIHTIHYIWIWIYILCTVLILISIFYFSSLSVPNLIPIPNLSNYSLYYLTPLSPIPLLLPFPILFLPLLILLFWKSNNCSWLLAVNGLMISIFTQFCYYFYYWYLLLILFILLLLILILILLLLILWLVHLW